MTVGELADVPIKLSHLAEFLTALVTLSGIAWTLLVRQIRSVVREELQLHKLETREQRHKDIARALAHNGLTVPPLTLTPAETPIVAPYKRKRVHRDD